MEANEYLFGHFTDQGLLRKQIEWGRRVFSLADVRSDDSCLVFSRRVDGRRPVNYNRWWVFQPFADGRLGFLVTPDAADKIESASYLKMELRNEYALEVGTWVVLDDADPDHFPPYVTESAVDALQELAQRGYHGSPNANSNNPLYNSFFFDVAHVDPALLLSWNPVEWSWDNLDEESEKTSEGAVVKYDWRTMNRKDVFLGMRCFLIKQGAEPRGIMASGRVVRLPFPNGITLADGKDQYSVSVEYDIILNPDNEELLTRMTLLETSGLSSVHWDTQASGILIPPKEAAALEAHWHDHLYDISHIAAGMDRSSLAGTRRLEFTYS